MPEFLTASDLYDAGWSWGFHRDSLAHMLDVLRAELGTLEEWQVDAMTRGHAQGVSDGIAYANDMATRADVTPVSMDEIPF